jgi:hypothetical protein
LLVGHRLIDGGEPVARTVDGPVTQVRIHVGRAFAASPQAAPTPVLGALYQLCSQRVGLNVSAHGEKMRIFLNREAFESALVERALAGG